MRGGGEEHRSVHWGDIQLNYDTELNMEYLSYNERQTKTRTGADVNNTRDGKPRMYATPQNKQRCPVEAHKTFCDKRPSNYSENQHPFYGAPVMHVFKPHTDAQWFLRGPVGRNKLDHLMKTMVQKANLPDVGEKRLTNTSVRKHLCQKLLEKKYRTPMPFISQDIKIPNH